MEKVSNQGGASLTREAFLRATAVAGMSVLAAPLFGCGDDSSSVSGPKVSSAEEAAQRALAMAREAAKQGTFGVGGLMVENSTGRVLQEMHNNVLKPLAGGTGTPGKMATFDPTAHGERQMISWYFANRERLGLPAPEKCTIITSLDPCAMCTGSILAAGFNAGVLAYDADAGISFDKAAPLASLPPFEGDTIEEDPVPFSGLPPSLRKQARETFGYYGVEGGRRYSGSRSVAFASDEVTMPTFRGCAEVFDKSVKEVRKEVSSGAAPASLADPAALPAGSPLKQAFTAAYEGAFSLKLKDYRRPTEELSRTLEQLKASSPGAKNAVAFIDPFGNLLCAAPDTLRVSPIATAFMNVTQMYSKTRFALLDSVKGHSEARSSLASPNYGTFVFLHAPTPGVAVTVKDLGAYGSTTEGPLPVPSPSGFQFYDEPVAGTVAGLREQISIMPPFYSQIVRINPQPVGA